MSKSAEIINSLNLPKQILDKTEKVLGKLFGPSFDEIGQAIADQVRIRRFKNQLKIFTQAQKILQEQNISPKKVSLKVLAPLLDLSSYEEDVNIQEKWANLTAHILTDNSDLIFQQNCMSILNKMSSADATLLDSIYELFNKKRLQRNTSELNAYLKNLSKNPVSNRSLPKKHDELSPSLFPLKVSAINRNLKTDETEMELYLTNLITFGLIKWETNVQVSAFKDKDLIVDDDIELKVKVLNQDRFVFTPSGIKFMKICNKK